MKLGKFPYPLSWTKSLFGNGTATLRRQQASTVVKLQSTGIHLLDQFPLPFGGGGWDPWKPQEVPP